MPNAKEVPAPKNRWKVMFVRGSVKADVVWPRTRILGTRRAKNRRLMVRLLDMLNALFGDILVYISTDDLFDFGCRWLDKKTMRCEYQRWIFSFRGR